MDDIVNLNGFCRLPLELRLHPYIVGQGKDLTFLNVHLFQVQALICDSFSKDIGFDLHMKILSMHFQSLGVILDCDEIYLQSTVLNMKSFFAFSMNR